MLICPKCGRASRIGYRFLEATDAKGRAKKVRFCKSCDATIDE
jgi:large subunit ribosomal protein L24